MLAKLTPVIRESDDTKRHKIYLEEIQKLRSSFADVSADLSAQMKYVMSAICR
jgi:hypothetical protein